MRASFPSAQGCTVGKPRSRHANLEGRTPGRRAPGVAFLFGYFLFGEALRRRSGANAEGGPEGAEGRMPGVKRK